MGRLMEDAMNAAALRPTKIKCFCQGGVCPIVGCNEDGECYLWRCEHPHAQKPQEDE